MANPPKGPRSTDETPAGSVKVAMAQISPVLGDRHQNFQLHLQQIDEARQQGADLIVFPELSLTGYCLRDMVPDVAIRRDSPEIHELVEAAGAGSLVVGLVEESARGRFFNAALYGEGGQTVHVHRKVYLPTYGLFDERRYFAPGNRIEAFDTVRFGRVGVLICEDLWHLSAAAIMQAEEVDLLVCVANSPARGVAGSDIETARRYRRMCETFAQLLGAVVVFVNRVGFEDGLCFWGGSMVVGPDGTPIAEAPMLDEALTMATVNLDDLRRQRLIAPLGRDERMLVVIEELNRIRRQRYDS
jgi:NAD+ synthase (glutamine-hydrolysing)